MKCKKCGTKMVKNTDFAYTSDPLQYKYECPECGYSEIGTAEKDFDIPSEEDIKKAKDATVKAISKIFNKTKDRGLEYLNKSKEVMQEALRIKVATACIPNLISKYSTYKVAAKVAFDYADAFIEVLEERNKEKKNK